LIRPARAPITTHEDRGGVEHRSLGSAGAVGLVGGEMDRRDVVVGVGGVGGNR